MCNGVIIIPHHDLKQLPCWYYGEYKVNDYEFAVVTYGITTLPISLISAQSLSSYEKHTDGHHLSRGWVVLG
jgi:hypothetical protein